MWALWTWLLKGGSTKPMATPVAAASGGTDFAAELTDYSPGVTGSCLILGA